MPNSIPHTIGIIMDGNRRWARERGLHTLEGHKAGADKVLEVAKWAQEHGIQEVILYAFSTENWNRAPEEVGYLMDLSESLFGTQITRFEASGVRLRFIGDLSRARPKLQEIMRTAEERTKHGAKGTLVFAFSYGGRAEILTAVEKLLSEGVKEVTEEIFRSALWGSDIKDPDLILRTGGEQRLSNFLTWQSVYSELFFTDTKWPDLTKEEFLSILETFAERERRHGT